MRHWTASPSLLHGRRHRLSASWSPGLTTAADDAAEDREEEETAYAGCDADDEVFVVVDPATDFFGCGGAFALALGELLEVNVDSFDVD